MAVEVIIDIDGFEQRSRAGWGAVVRLRDISAEARDTLCSSCDPCQHTGHRAELRAAQWALHFLHQLAKIGHPPGRCRNQRGRRGRARRSAAHDERPVDPTYIKFIIRTDSLYLIRGMQRVVDRSKNYDIWHEMDNCSGCMLSRGIRIEFEHVRLHTDDEWGQRASALAKSAAAGTEHEDNFSRCVSCDVDFEDGYLSLAQHVRDVHIDPIFDVDEESSVLTVHEDEYRCQHCPRVLADRFALDQHMLDKHGR